MKSSPIRRVGCFLNGFLLLSPVFFCGVGREERRGERGEGRGERRGERGERREERRGERGEKDELFYFFFLDGKRRK